ncbi:MAG TPA: nuclear transport factor 2 family protein [Polyangiales bacterium]
MTDSKTIALAYLDAVASKDMERCNSLLAPDVTFKGPASDYRGPAELLAAFRRLSSIHIRNDVVRVFAEGNEVCVIYDFVTDAMGTMQTIEWLKIENGKIQSINLYYDQVPWVKIREEMTRRAKASA